MLVIGRAGGSPARSPRRPDRDAIRLSFDTKVIGVKAISPGVIDTGAWDALGKQGKADYFADMCPRNPARRNLGLRAP